MTPAKKRLLRVVLVVVSFVVTLLALEVGLRTYLYFSSIDISNYQPSFVYAQLGNQDRTRFTTHPFLPYAPRPFDARTMSSFRPDVGRTVDLAYVHNSLGFRSPERPFAKPPKTKRVITLGGSTTYDGPTNEQTWSALLEKRLNEHYASTGYTIEVINMSVDMGSSPISLINLAFLGVEFQPDLVISYDGVNDAWIQGADGLMPDYRTVMSKYDDQAFTLQASLPLWALRSYLVTWASFKFDRSRFTTDRPDLAGQVIDKKLATLKPSTNPLAGLEYFQRNLRLMRAISAEYNANFLAATAHWVRPHPNIDKMNEELRKFFKAERIDFLDLDKLLPHDDFSIHVDQVHWSLEGEEAMAKLWSAKIIATDALNFARTKDMRTIQ